MVKRSHAAAAHKTHLNAQGGWSALFCPAERPGVPKEVSWLLWVCVVPGQHLPQITTPLTPAQAVACIAACDRAP